MQSSEAHFSFPVLGFTPDREIWGFPDMDRLTKCGPRTLKEGVQNGMELIDTDGRRWRVLSVRRTGRAGSVLSLLWIFGPPQSRIEQELEPLPVVSLEEVQQRARDAMETSRIDYYGEEGQAEYRSMIRKIGKTRSISKIYDLLQPDTFESY
ncbi:hypothetical protein [Phenylobacterium sp.]|uniref:hypothetical protein n=1 Tax=Phenylobacterium sp. TaxID=1871053 RepID=UPI0025E93D37|nr:hypothetical protein [Phenylobacterium sp.]MBX3482379.1 hypothetical protein [Phenylobacterium sp.]MCW5557936.1 hypothetical protein [Verrucomicrobiae bacterium]